MVGEGIASHQAGYKKTRHQVEHLGGRQLELVAELIWKCPAVPDRAEMPLVFTRIPPEVNIIDMIGR